MAMDDDPVLDPTDSDAPAATFATIAGSVDATGALTPAGRADLERSIETAAQEVAAVVDSNTLISMELARMAWFASRGATGAGQWPGDPDDFAKQVKALAEFEAWWLGSPARMRAP